MKHRMGAPVRQIMPAPIRGTVEDMELDKATGEIRIMVSNTCEEGHIHSRWMPESAFEADTDAQPTQEHVDGQA